MALQVASGGVACRCPPALPGGGGRRTRGRTPRAVASGAAAAVEEGEGKVRLDVCVVLCVSCTGGITTSKTKLAGFPSDLCKVFDASIDNGMTFFDTAEVYGTALMGAVNSESLLGGFIKERQQMEQIEVAVATKFAALPWRFGRGSVLSALKKSLDRLGLSSVELYQLHWTGIWGNEAYLDGLADAYEQGLVKSVGVSNYNGLSAFRDAHARLKKRGVPLAANQVNYSRIYRTPELNGVKAACDELGITLIAYSPIAQGVLTGKYTSENPPTGPRANTYTPEFLTKLQPLMSRIKEIGASYGKSPTQGNVVPIPGAKNASQAKEFAGALGWSLTGDEVEELRTLAREIKGIKMPIEES
ncbi:hypothetical protein PVAP13_J643801 [Panicum virgatum]|nr:hypothetical protein PVAP13_J643801 [Panicum virgatum]